MSEYQRDKQFSFKSIKSDERIRPWQKFLAVGGGVAAVWHSILGSNMVVSLLEYGGLVAGGMAIDRIVNPENSLVKSAFLTVGGVALGAAVSFIPIISPLLHQITGTITTAGLTGFVKAGVRKLQK